MTQATRSYRDLHEHLQVLQKRGLVRTIDRPIDKDSGIASAGALAVRRRPRRGKSQGLPVHQHHRRARAQIRHSRRGRRHRRQSGDLQHRHGRQGRGHPGQVGSRYRQSDRAAAGQRGGLPRGRDRGQSAAGRRPRPRQAADPGVDAGLRQRADADRDQRHHARSRDRHSEHGHLPRGVEGAGPAGGAHGDARRRRRRLPALSQVPEARRADALRHRARLPALCGVHGSAEAADRRRRIHRRRRPCRRADQCRARAHASTCWCRPNPSS